MLIKNIFKDLSIRKKLLYGYSMVFIVIILLGSIVLYSFIRRTLSNNIEQELNNYTVIISNLVKTTVSASIRNHMRALVRNNVDIIKNIYNRYKQGDLSEDEAKNLAYRMLQSHCIGKTGYIYCIDSKGIIRKHPKKKLINIDLSKWNFIQEQLKRKEGYLEYDWANPGEETARPKALYMSYFKPWDWIVTVSAYREEFQELFDVQDLRKSILSIAFGQTGYPYIIDTCGNLIIHPKLEGQNIYNSKDVNGRMFIKEICNKRRGKIIYPWKNPGEYIARDKLVIFNDIKELNWIIASSGYLDELYSPLNKIAFISVATIVISLIFVFLLTSIISSSITRPLHKLMEKIALGAEGDFSVKIDIYGNDEIGKLAQYFNSFMERIKKYSRKLLESEEKYRAIFENAVEGICQTDPWGKFLSANPSMAMMLGYDTPEHLVNFITDIDKQLYVDKGVRKKMLSILKQDNIITDYEARFYRKDDTIIWVSLNSRAVKDADGKIVYIESFLTNLTNRKNAEESLKKVNEELEKRVGERTAELSGWISKLEQRNYESMQLNEMIETLQICHNVEETYPVIAYYAKRLFPQESGSLYVFNKDKNNLESVVTWGNSLESISCFPHENCWAMRHGKNHLVENAEQGLLCDHFAKAPEKGYLCIPMVAQGEIMGIFHLQFVSEISSLSDEEKKYFIESRQRLVISLSKNLALAFANLNLKDTLRQQSIIDPLTGLFNRRYLDETLNREVHRSKRNNKSIGIIMMDLDHFKNINDAFGHEIGDIVLQEFGAYLKKRTRGEDILCRYGGEEFVLIMPGVSLENATKRAQELRTGIKNNLKIKVKREIIHLTISIGVSVFTSKGANILDALKDADMALYKAKSQGRDRVIAYSEFVYNDECH